jgi:hypothetical protein
MSLIPNPLNTLLARTRSAVRRRRGSVLILVVALLLLLLIVGTAFLTTSRTERYAAIQDSVNTQADLLLSGVENALSGQIAGKDFTPGSTQFRQASTALAQVNDVDSPQADLYLSSRLPGGSAAAPTWPSISLPPAAVANGNTRALYQIEPLSGGLPTALIQYYSASGAYNAGDIVVVPGQSPVTYYAAISGGTTLAAPSTANIGTVWRQVNPKEVFKFYIGTTTDGQPGLAIQNNIADPTGAAGYLNPPTTAQYTAGNLTSYGASYFFPAADSDGDGIPDSLLFRLPVGQIDGVTYVAAVRVLDGNSAVNVSTAGTNATDADSTGTAVTQYVGMFRPNVGLSQLLTAPTELTTLNGYRFNGSIASTTPIGDSSTPAIDFTFLTQADAFENQLVRRPLNPGYNTAGVHYQWIGTAATSALANRFCLQSAVLAPTDLESAYLKSELNSAYNTYVKSSPYTNDSNTTTGLPAWFKNFNFPTTGATPNLNNAPLRSVLVGNNAVSNAVYGHYVSKGAWVSPLPASTSPDLMYHFGDWVTIPGTAGGTAPGYAFVCIQDHLPMAANQPTVAMATTEVHGVPPVPAHTAGDAYWAPVPWLNVPTKISASAGTFAELWTAYWNVMWDHPAYPPTAPPTPQAFAQPMFGYPRSKTDTITSNLAVNQNVYPLTAATSNAARMFRSVIRDPNANAATPGNSQYLTPGQMMLLRSALSALNLTSMRAASDTTSYPLTANGLDDVISQQVTIPADPADGASRKFNVMLFGATKQPYISEVFVDLAIDGSVNSIGIELCNPYPHPTGMTLNNWNLARLNRSTSGYSSGPAATMILKGSTATAGIANFPIPAATVVPPASATACGKLLLYDFTGGTAPSWVPTTPGTTAGTENAVRVTGLSTVGPMDSANGQEVVLLRPRAASGAVGTGTDTISNPYDEQFVADLCPVDQIDMTALTANAKYDYRRGTTVTGAHAWNFVYSGPYSCTATGNDANFTYRHGGWVTLPATSDPTFGAEKAAFSGTVSTDPTTGQPSWVPVSAASTATFPTFSMQIAALDAAGFNQVSATAKQSPFGGFVRAGDLLQVPFVGAYRIMPPTVASVSASTIVTEVNSLPMDSAFADCQDMGSTTYMADQPQSTDATLTTPFPMREQIGRFCMVGDPQVTYMNGTPNSMPATNMDFYPAIPVTGVPNSNVNWRYRWASRLFDFIAPHTPQDDYLPDTDPQTYTTRGGGAVPAAVANRSATVANNQTAGSSEDTVGVEGLVNINTAPVPVLASIPWIPPTASGYTDPTYSNSSLAAAIVAYRDAHGPFQSLFDLYKVQEIQQAAANQARYANAGAAQARPIGDLESATVAIPSEPTAPVLPGPDRPQFDFEKQYLLLNRVSNLLTTHSDTFTCYVLLQGYRGVDGGNPTLVVQRRATFLLDRNGVTPTNKTASVLPVPNN